MIRGRLSARAFTAAAALLLALLPTAAPALVLRGGPINTSPPAGALAGSGWDFIGRFETGNASGFAATAIGHCTLLTARHLGFRAGDVFRFRGTAWTVARRVDLPDSDLAVGIIDGTFPFFAPLNEETNEVGAACVLFGPGRMRGEPVTDAGGNLRGWKWTNPAPAGLRWGTNTVARLTRWTNAFAFPGTVELLVGDFVSDGGDDLAAWAWGDSGAPLFVATPQGWRLAGIASAADGPFAASPSPLAATFDASLFDAGGFWLAEQAGPRVRVPELPGGKPTSWYASRVAPHVARLRQIMAETGCAPAITVTDSRVSGAFAGQPGRTYRVEIAADAAGPWTLLLEAEADAAGRVAWTSAASAMSRFYRAVAGP